MPALGRALRKGLSIVADERVRFLTLNTGLTTAAGRKVAPATSPQAAAVYASTSLVAQRIASLPLDFLLRGDESRVPQRPEQVRALWGRPNPDQSRINFYETLLMSLLLWGNFYGYPRYNDLGELVEIWPIDPDRVTEIERLEVGRADSPMLGLRFRIEDFGWVENRPGQRPQLVHIPWITMPGRVKGMSPVEFHAELIGMSLSAQEHAARFLGEGTHMSGVIQTPAELDDAEAKELWEQWQLQHAGPRKAGRVGILSGGATFNTLTIPPNELQFLEQMKYSDRKIASIYRVPAHMIGDTERSTSWGTGIEEQTKGFVVYTLLPIAAKVEQAFEASVLPPDIQMRFQMNGLLRGSPRDRAEFYRVMQSLGNMSANEVRVLEDMPPIGGEHGDRYYIPLNVVPADAPPEDIESRFRVAAVGGAFNAPAVAPVAGPAAAPDGAE